MACTLITFGIITCIAHVSAMSLAEIDFAGIGSKKCTETMCTYTFSKHFTDDICYKKPGLFGSSRYGASCWNGEGISYYDGYITRSFYQKGNTHQLNGNINGDNSINSYTAISVTKESDASYSVILMDTPFECHAGDNVLTKINGIYWFMIACEQNNAFYKNKYLAIFNENDIQKLEGKNKIRANGKTFSYFVSQQNVIMRTHSDVSLDFISRNDGVDNEYFTGNYYKKLKKKQSKTNALNLKRIKIDPDDSWEITVLETYTAKSGKVTKVQGAVRIGDYMLLSTNTIIRRCNIDENKDGSHTIDFCYKQCKLKLNKDKAVALQGAETDGNGRFFVGSEWGKKHDSRFFIINDIVKMEDHEQYCETYDFENAKSNAGEEAESELPEFVEYDHNEYSDKYGQKFVLISPWIVCIAAILILGLSFSLCLMYSRYKKQNKNRDKHNRKIDFDALSQSELNVINVVDE